MFIAGPYFWYYGNGAQAGNVLGVVEDAIRIRRVMSHDEITGDDYGDTIQAVVYRGGNTFLDMVFLEWNLVAAQAAMEPYGNILNDNEDYLHGQIGRAGVNQGGGPVLGNHAVGTITSSVSGTDERQRRLLGRAMAGQTPTWIRAEEAVLAPGQSSDVLFGSRSRNVPVSFLCLPFIEPDDPAETDPTANEGTAFTIRYTETPVNFSAP